MVYFVDMEENITLLNCVMDERVCCDTIFRALRIYDDMYLLCDLWVLNGMFIHSHLNFTDRMRKIADILEWFHSPDFVAFIQHDDVPHDIPIRGYEYYDTQLGSTGIFVAVD